jgi:DNA repair protein RadC
VARVRPIRRLPCPGSSGSWRRTAFWSATEDALAFCREQFARLAGDGAQEEGHVVSLGTKHQVIGTHRIAVGSLDAGLIRPREVFRPAIKDAAAAILLVHNHPSGDPTPSPEDLAFTRRMEDAGKDLGVEVLDHVIVARDGALRIRDYRRFGCAV